MYVHETNSVGPDYHTANENNQHPVHKYVDWSYPGLKITRLRLLTDPGVPFWDVSYCDGELEGCHVSVLLPFNQLPKKNPKGALLEYARRDGLYAKGTGILDCMSRLW